LVFLILLTACGRQHSVLKYASARRIVIKEQRPGQLLLSGMTIHSGSCVEEVRQERDGPVVTLVVKLVTARGPCSGEFFAVIPVGSSVNAIKLGIPKSSDPQELGVVWTRSP
jgi:hypothetical protein